jgi:hypothetical protein
MTPVTQIEAVMATRPARRRRFLLGRELAIRPELPSVTRPQAAARTNRVPTSREVTSFVALVTNKSPVRPGA